MFLLLSRINWLNPLVLAGIFVLLVAGVKWVRPMLYWPVEGVQVIGPLDHIDRYGLQVALADTLAPGFLASDMDAVKQRVETLPWVGEAQVQRLWPDQVEVIVKKRVPVANWLQNGVLDSNLTSFFPAQRPDLSLLPKLAGPEGAEKEVWHFYQSVTGMLKPLGLEVDVVSLAGHGAWSVHIKDGPWLLVGKDQISDRVRRMASAYDELSERWQSIRLVDLRYPNGFAVEWMQ